MDRDNAYIQHIKDAIELTEKFVTNIEYESFLEDKKTQSAVVRQIEIIGEASKRLSTDFKKANGKIPWKDIAGMRDKLIHDYMEIDVIAVWETVQQDIPDLKKKIGF